MDKRIEKYISIVPSERQKEYQEMGFNVFFHYGMNTFTGKEWGDGKTPASTFNPTNQNTDQWVEAIKKAGAKGVILTCKHHDGFCLWPTDTTEYSVKNSPYKNGKGDVVKEVSDSCKKYGLKFGVYLSPWDRNSEYYGTEKYNDFYIQQLTELLTRYGDIFCVWLDGACGAHMDGKSKQEYDFDRIYNTVRKLQPNACISNCGPDVRWVGNEGGYARESEWNIVPKFQFSTQNIAAKSQQDEDGEKMQSSDTIKDDIGSRAALAPYDEFIWYPAEVDVSVRPGWFYHKKEDSKVRSLNNLLNIYYTSVWGNSLLLLNAPPSKEGLLAENDVKRLAELGEAIENAFKYPVKVASVSADAAKDGFQCENITIDDESAYSPAEKKASYTITLNFEKPCVIDKVALKEQCDFSQRVENFEIYALTDSGEKKIYSGTIIGFRKLALFAPIEAKGIKVKITACRSVPYIQNITAYCENGGVPTFTKFEIFASKVEKFFRDIGSKIYFMNEKRKNKKAAKK